MRGEVRLADAVPVGVRDQDYPGEIAVFPDGRFVYVSVRGANTIAALRTGRALTPVQAAPAGGNWPRHFTFDASARRLFVSDQRSGTVTWLPRIRRPDGSARHRANWRCPRSPPCCSAEGVTQW
ncbi:lactonase family protein [Amycolatopsis sp. 3B14]|uniref:lactonase family protein n=1 Tax=Amycolatopsis sp. 3B14 TaxID=3243600 RepID=UPI003D9A02CD